MSQQETPTKPEKPSKRWLFAEAIVAGFGTTVGMAGAMWLFREWPRIRQSAKTALKATADSL
jgi:hypothetical protein